MKFTEPPPIRTVDAMKCAAANWEGAMMVWTASDDPDECRRAYVAVIREERRMDEARHLFEFGEEGDLIGLANIKPSQETADSKRSEARHLSTCSTLGRWHW